MMRKLIFVLAAAAIGGFFICSSSVAQTYSPAALSGGVCCNHGKPEIPPGQKCLLLHQVGPGENLHILAAYYYGNARAWRQIYNLNKKDIRNPNRIRAGQIIKIEVEPCWTPRFDLAEFMRLEEARIQMVREMKGPRREIRTREVVEPTVTVIIEEEEEEEVEEEGPAEVPGLGPIPRVEPEEGE